MQDIATKRKIPKSYLEQILLKLKRGGLVHSKKGPNGGYSLSRTPSEISLKDVVLLMEGSLELYPFSTSEVEDLASKTKFFDAWTEVESAFISSLEQLTMDIIQERELRYSAQQVMTYFI